MDNRKNIDENEQGSTMMFDTNGLSVDDLLEDYRSDPSGDDPDSEEIFSSDPVSEEPEEVPEDEPEPSPAWETRTVAVTPQQPTQADDEEAAFSEDDGLQQEDELPPEENLLSMPQFRRRIFKRIPKRVYHRRRLFSFVYVITTVLICVFVSVMFLRVFNDVLAFSTENEAITVEIEKDDTTDDVAQKLMDAGLIKYGWLFSYVAKFEGQTAPYEPGEHTLNDNMNYMQLLDEIEIKQNARETVWVTFTEGMTLDEIAETLEENGVCDAEEFEDAAKSDTDYGYDFEKEMSGSDMIYYPLEGYLFPDTYQFYTNDTPANIINKILQNFQNKIEDVQPLMKEMGLTQHQTITLASIIEAEASGDPDNMRLVSSVYWNRLNDTENYPRLQSDPTRDYANATILMAGKSLPYQTKAKEYDTYQCEGLPAGPICNPGMAAINAALQPESTSYYYFCSNTKTGEFYYAGTLQEHNQNVDQIG